MRRQLRMRGVILLVVGFAGGLALAVLLSRLVVSLIRVSGTTGVPDPPLRLDPDWLVAGQALRRPPFAGLVVDSRAAIERRLAGDPLAHATAIALGAAGLVALVLAVLGFWVGVASELHDEKSDFFDLEAQGLPPADMRRQLRMRGVILLVVGFAGGLALAVLLSRLVVSLIRVSGTTGVPEPPLRLDPDWLVAGLGIAALMLAALLVAEAASLAAFRGNRPERASWSLE